MSRHRDAAGDVGVLMITDREVRDVAMSVGAIQVFDCVV
jgi:hypothetical protein